MFMKDIARVKVGQNVSLTSVYPLLMHVYIFSIFDHLSICTWIWIYAPIQNLFYPVRTFRLILQVFSLKRKCKWKY